jgi:hypothetical protein
MGLKTFNQPLISLEEDLCLSLNDAQISLLGEILFQEMQ